MNLYYVWFWHKFADEEVLAVCVFCITVIIITCTGNQRSVIGNILFSSGNVLLVRGRHQARRPWRHMDAFGGSDVAVDQPDGIYSGYANLLYVTSLASSSVENSLIMCVLSSVRVSIHLFQTFWRAAAAARALKHLLASVLLVELPLPWTD